MICSRCKRECPAEDFAIRNGKPTKTCAACRATAARKRVRIWERRALDPAYDEHVRAHSRNYWRRKREEIYGLDQGQLDRLTAEQDGRCAICRRTPDEVACQGKTGEVLHVDHNHETLVVRGLLCKKCNSLLGMVDDDVDRLMAAVAYLLQHQNVLSGAQV